MADYEVLEPGGHAHLVSDIKAYVDRAGGVGTTQIADEAVTMDKLADGAVTQEKLAQDVQQVINISGAADALMGDPSESTWATRTSTGSGMARVESVQGAAVVWNQLNNNTSGNYTSAGVAFINNGDGSWTASGTATANSNKPIKANMTLIVGHKYAVKGSPVSGLLTFNGIATGAVAGGSAIYENTSITNTTFRVDFARDAVFNETFWPQLFDLTAMFGAGNEPSTVAEFEQMYPEPYYPYSAPTLKPVQIAGVESVGFNQWDEQWEVGGYNGTTGAKYSTNDRIRSKNAISILSNTAYYFKCPKNFNLYYYDATGGLVSTVAYSSVGGIGNSFTTPANAHYMRFATQSTYGTTYNHDICLNVSNPALNGQYEPYTTDSVEWETQTLRAAGSVRDMLYSDHVNVRVGVVDLGTLDWTSTTVESQFRAARPSDAKASYEAQCAQYTFVGQKASPQDKQMSSGGSGAYVIVQDSAYTTVADFKAAMSGVLLYYELDTPTTTPISPALPMSYRVEQGGTESIIVPDGEVSATPVITVAEGESAAELVMDALAAIAAPDGPTATANHAVGTYLTMGGVLYRVTTAIATGEAIVTGTNVQATTVMDEVIRLTQ